MSMTTLFMIGFLSGAGYGAVRGEMQVRRLRGKRAYEDIAFGWFDRMPAGPASEGLIWLAPLIHFVGICSVALMAVVAIPDQAVIPDPSSIAALLASFPHNFLGALSLALIAYLWGYVLPVNPFGNPLAKEGYFAISTEGILYGGNLFPWSRFTHFNVDLVSGVNRVFSATSPGLVAFAFLPSKSVDRPRLPEALSQHLPPAAPEPAPGTWPRWCLPGFTAGAAAAVVLASFFLLRSTGLFALPAAAVLTHLYVTLGGRLMMRLGFGGRGLPIGPNGP